MSNLPPAAVLAKRLEHKLLSASYAADADSDKTGRIIREAQEILAQLQEAMR